MKIVKVENGNNDVVAKANELIKAKGALSGASLKMLSMVISMLRVDDTDFSKYALCKKDYLNAIDSISRNDEWFEDRAKELMNNPFKIDKRFFNWCSMVDFKEIPGYMVFDIHPILKSYLLELQKSLGFTQYKVINVLSLRGEYVFRFYELLKLEFEQYKAQYIKKYKKTPKSFTFELEIDILKSMFKIPDSYLYGDIKRNILEKAKKQLKEKTDIKFTYKEDKLGRKVIGIFIKIENNNKGSNDYLHDIKTFIAYMRKNYINKDILKGQDKETKQVYMISISEKGLLYDKNGTDFNHKRSKEIWDKLYNLALENKLYCLKSLFDT